MPICPVQLTKDLIACPSVTPRDEGAQILLGRHLTALGFACHPMAFGEVPNLFARLGASGPHLCFAGHTDVVPPGPLERWTSPPFEPTVREGVLYGRGAADMKSGVACFAAAVSRYLERHGPPPGSVGLLITGDEEGPGTDGTVRVLEWMERQGHIPDACVVGECSNPDRMGQEIKIGRRGSFTGRLSVAGKQCHVAWPDRGRNPVPDLVRLLSALHAARLDEGTADFPPSGLEVTEVSAGAGADNIIPGEARATIKSRFAGLWTGQTIAARIRDILDSAGAAYDMEVVIGGEVFLTPADDPWAILVADAVADVSGARPEMTTTGGTSDARFIHRYCPVVEYGAVGRSAHQIDEHVALADLETLTQTYVRVLERYFGVARKMTGGR